MAKDYYSILGIPRSASPDEIKAAYRKMSKELHPDKHKGDKAAETKFKEVNEAYETLTNPQKKQMYDQFGTTGGAGGGGFGGGAGFDPRGFDFSGFQQGGNVNFSDLFESFFGGQGGGRGARTRTDKGDDREVQIEISFMESVTGVENLLSIKRLVKCDRCDASGAEKGAKIVTCSECAGTGQVTRTAQSFFGTVQQRMVCPTCQGSGKIPEKPCSKCSGEGRIQESVKVTVNVPAGIDHGQTLRLRGEGDAGRRGAESGDLYVHIAVAKDDRFEREGDNIRTDLTLPVVDAILGADAEVETVQGTVTLSIPAGTQPGQMFRIKGKGMPVLNARGHGDHYVTVTVQIPAKLSREERRLLEEWKKIS